MSSVGIIANPSSGKDIRRIVAQGWVVTTQEKVAITRRLLKGLEAVGIEEVYFMPEPRGICQEALSSIGSTSLKAKVVNIPILGRQEDSTAAAAAMVKAGVGCIITLGGDGTNRAVFKGCGSDMPILPVSTGTNNVFPEFQEGTMAGYAAGLIALGKVPREIACWRSKVLLVKRNSIPVDLALVDLAVSTENIIGARAIWDATNISELFLTRAQPWSIGLSAIGGAIRFLPAEGQHGMHLKMGQGGRKIHAPIGPGLFADLYVLSNTLLSVGESVTLTFDQPAALAFDGERDLIARPSEELMVELSANGPWVVETPRTVCAFIAQ